MDSSAVEEWFRSQQRVLASVVVFIGAALVGLVMLAVFNDGSDEDASTAALPGLDQGSTSTTAVGVALDSITTPPGAPTTAPSGLVVTVESTGGSTETSSTSTSSTVATSTSSTVATTTTTTTTSLPSTTSSTAPVSTTTASTTMSTTGANPTTTEGPPGTSATTAAPTSTTIRPITTTTRPATTATSNRPGAATYHGVREFNSFFQGNLQYDAWTAGDVAFYAPPGQVSRADGERWVEWYRRVDELYRQMSTKDNFESVYRRDDPNFGRVKVLGIVETCGAGCGSKQQAEADPGYIPRMVAEPNNPDAHWIFFYEMGRVGSASAFEDFYARATWPTNTLIVPHMMAAVAYYDLGGESLLYNGNTKFLFEELDRWEAENIDYVDQFPIPDQQSQNGYTSHHLMPAMLLTIATETDLNTLWQILENMSNEPLATSATQAMCDFQDAVNAATGGRYSGRMKGEWGLPDTCP